MSLQTKLSQIQSITADVAAEGFLICSGDNFRVVYASKGIDRILGHAQGDPQETELSRLLSASSALDHTARITIMARLENARMLRADCAFSVPGTGNEQLPVNVELHRVGDTHWIISFEDSGARREVEDRVVTLALTDPLTGLGNRMRFRQSLSQALAAASAEHESVALILVDLDRFKTVNDTLGHPVGDQLLRKVSERLHTVIRQSDMLARLGGDEFAAWLPSSIESDELARRASRIVDLMSRPFLIDGMQVNIGASVGIALAPRDGAEYEALMKNADLALYSAKAAGRGTFRFFDPEMERRAQERRNIEIDLRKALTLRQFEVYYRPQIDIETRALTSLEAHLRWRHPERGVLEPANFIQIAEEIGLLAPIGKWTLETAIKDAAGWTKPINLVVALTSPQFETPSLIETVRQALSASSLPPSRLELEITENVLLRNEANVVKMLYELKSLGVRIGISDFGTGYASLTKLDSFPFDRIKLDTSLVDENVSSNRAIINAVVAFGASLGVNTMLDGIRTEEQLAKLRADGGRGVQGFMLIDPVPPVELSGWILGSATGVRHAGQTYKAGVQR